MNLQLTGKVALITGGGSGIGRHIAQRFAEAGARVAVLELTRERGADTVASIRERGGEARVYACDVADQARMRATAAAVTDDFGRIDILVNNAGIAHVGNLEQTTEADFDRLYQVNVKGVYNGMHACIGGMVAQGGGVILNLASIASKIAVRDRFAYSMSKGAVLTMTFSVAADYVGRGIRCNCICPARVHTPFVDNFIRQHYPGEEEERFRELSAYQPIGRMGRPEEIAALALFLCSEEAGFITGAAYDIDGGAISLR